MAEDGAETVAEDIIRYHPNTNNTNIVQWQAAKLEGDSIPIGTRDSPATWSAYQEVASCCLHSQWRELADYWNLGACDLTDLMDWD